MIEKIVLAAGGTGGHIYPAIAVADELKKINPDIRIIFIGAKGRMEEKIVPKYGYELRTIAISGFKRKFSFQNIKVLMNLFSSMAESKKYLKEFNPDIVFGTGGFVSGPVMKAASKLSIPTVIQEGNSYPGLTVKLLSETVTKVIINFDETKKFLKNQNNIVKFSYPVRDSLKRYNRTEALNYFELKADNKTLFVLGGSLGAASINNAVLDSLDKFLKENIQIIWQTGSNNFKAISEKVGNSRNIKVFQFIDEMSMAYSAADLVLCRSGISTIMETAKLACAALYVPYKSASDNHQQKNAQMLADKNAALMLLDDELNSKLYDTVIGIMNNGAKLSELRENIVRFSDTESAFKIARYLIELVEQRRN